MVSGTVALPRPGPRPALRRRSAARCPTRRPRSPGWSPALHDDDGRVQVPGFYDDVLELTDDRARAVRPGAVRRRRVPAPPASRGRWPARPATARWSGSAPGPTAEVNGIGGGYQGDGGKTIVPERRVRQAVLPAGRQPGPGQDPGRGRAVRRRAHAGRHRAPTIEWEGDGVAPCLVADRHPGLRARCAGRSARRSTADLVLPTREGGTRPGGRDPAGARRAAGVPRRRACPTTRSTRRTRRSSCRCSTRAPRRRPTCGRELATRRARPGCAAEQAPHVTPAPIASTGRRTVGARRRAGCVVGCVAGRTAADRRSRRRSELRVGERRRTT